MAIAGAPSSLAIVLTGTTDATTGRSQEERVLGSRQVEQTDPTSVPLDVDLAPQPAGRSAVVCGLDLDAAVQVHLLFLCCGGVGPLTPAPLTHSNPRRSRRRGGRFRRRAQAATNRPTRRG